MTTIAPTSGFPTAAEEILFPAGGPNIYTIFPSGVVVFGGAAAQLRTRTFAVSGGFALSGSADQIRTKFILPSGGVIFSGDAPMLFIPAGGGSVTTSLALMGVGQ